MGWWKELPYRGDGRPRNKKPRRRFRDLKKERREIIVSIFIVVVLFSIPASLFAFGQSPYDANGVSNTASLVIGAFLLLTLIIGILSISKFRKGYDIDISEETDPENSKDSEK